MILSLANLILAAQPMSIFFLMVVRRLTRSQTAHNALQSHLKVLSDTIVARKSRFLPPEWYPF